MVQGTMGSNDNHLVKAGSVATEASAARAAQIIHTKKLKDHHAVAGPTCPHLFNRRPPPTFDDSLSQDVLLALKGLAGQVSKDDGGIFFAAPLLPPISTNSLSELDEPSFMINPKLRRDINFEPHLFFRPNLDGHRGEIKKQVQRDYWHAVEVEICLYEVVYGGTTSDYLPEAVNIKDLGKIIQKRLPGMFETIKDIVIHLVPETDGMLVKEYMDVPLIMSEIEKLDLDFVGVTQTLATILKQHCAPVRDRQVDDMVRRMEAGDAVSTAAALRDLFTILETMKLDIANYQIRCQRGTMIERTIEFEKWYNEEAKEEWKPQLSLAKAWYLREKTDITGEEKCLRGIPPEFKQFIKALVRLLMPSCKEEFPQTFALDSRRLRALRANIQELHLLNICGDVLGRLVNLGNSTHPRLRRSFMNLQNSVQGMSRPWASPDDIFNSISLEIARHASLYLGEGEQPSTKLRDAAESLLRDYRDATVVRIEIAIVKNILVEVSRGRYLHISAWDLFNILVPPANMPNNLASIPTAEPKFTGPFGDIARRITHIAVLHWHTWAPMVYLNGDIEAEAAEFSEYSGEKSHNAGSPMDAPSRSPSPANTIPGRIAIPRDTTTLEHQRLHGQVPGSAFPQFPNVHTHQP